ncbi:hypothetical protein H4R33_005578 [Dimargaris cristalligena]|nr:hypothetical protein H4R33_005578 [Dimargaris cristalligena]
MGYSTSLAAIQCNETGADPPTWTCQPPPPQLGEHSRPVVHLERVLMPFGQANAPVLYAIFDEVMGEQEAHTFAALKFLSEFASQSHTNKFAMIGTPLLERILNLLETTLSFETMDVASNILTFVIPHMNRSLPEYFPRLLFILGRKLIWPRGGGPPLRAERTDPLASTTTASPSAPAGESSSSVYLYRPLSLSTIVLFSYLYGPLPFNTVGFLKDATGYMNGWITSQRLFIRRRRRQLSDTEGDEDGQLLAAELRVKYSAPPFQSIGFMKQAERLLRTHVYHPNFLKVSFQVVMRAPDAPVGSTTAGTNPSAADEAGTSPPRASSGGNGHDSGPFVVSPHANDMQVINKLQLPEYLELQNYASEPVSSEEAHKFVERCLDLQVDIVRKEWMAYFEGLHAHRELRGRPSPLPTTPRALPNRADSGRGLAATAGDDTEDGAADAGPSPKSDSDSDLDADSVEGNALSITTIPGHQLYQDLDIDSDDATDQSIFQLAQNIVKSYDSCVAHLPPNSSPSLAISAAAAAAAGGGGGGVNASPRARNRPSSPRVTTTNPNPTTPNAPAPNTCGDQAQVYRLANQLELERYIADCRMAQLGRWQAERIMRANAEVAEPLFSLKTRVLQERLAELKKHHAGWVNQEYSMRLSENTREQKQAERSRHFRDETRTRNTLIQELRHQIEQRDRELERLRDQAFEAHTGQFQLQAQLETNLLNVSLVSKYRDEIDKLTALLMVSKHGLDAKDRLETQYQALAGSAQLLQTEITAGQRTLADVRSELRHRTTECDRWRQRQEHLAREHEQCAVQLESVRTNLVGQVQTLQRDLEDQHRQYQQVLDQNHALRASVLNLECRLVGVEGGDRSETGTTGPVESGQPASQTGSNAQASPSSASSMDIGNIPAASQEPSSGPS